jgi:hypothetical protein
MFESETWSLALRVEYGLRVFGNGMLRGILGPKKQEVTGGLRKLHDVELCNLYSSPDLLLLLLLPLAPQPLVRPWSPSQSSSIYPSPTPTLLVAAVSSIRPNFWRLLNIFVFTG